MRPETTNVRLREEDWVLIDALRAKTGAGNVSEVIRQALRALATKEGVK